MATKKTITPKQKRFADEYLIDLNATQAAIRAGYSPKAASEGGYHLLRNPKVAAYIEARQAVLAERTGITQERVLTALAEVGFGDIRGFFDASGNLRAIPDLSPAQAAMLAGFEVATSVSEDEGVTRTAKIKMTDRLRALELMGKHLGMFADRVKHDATEELLAMGRALGLVAGRIEPGKSDPRILDEDA